MSKLASHQRDWNELAELDPLYAILTARGKDHGRWDPDEFFATGAREIDALVNKLGIQPKGRALDFGCGVGRLSKALKSHFSDVYGVDISPRMIELAREAVVGCTFVTNENDDLSLFQSNFFDLIYSNIVLQHLPTREIARSYIREFVRVLKPGGKLVFQMPAKLGIRYGLQLKRRLYSALRIVGFPPAKIYELGLNPMRCIALTPEEIALTVAAVGGILEHYCRDTFNHHSFTYVVSK